MARGFLILGALMALGTVVAATSSEEAGMQMAMATAGPLGFGVVATLMTGKRATGGAAKPLGVGCVVGFLLSLALVVFFTAIWPSL